MWQKELQDMLARTLRMLGALLLLSSVAQAVTIKLPERGRVRRVVDGDTLVVRTGGRDYKVRLIGADTPEAQVSQKLQRDAQRTGLDKALLIALGKKATELTRKLCKGRSCTLEYDPANEEKGHRDSYGRLLVYLSVRHKGKMCLVNAELIRQGYAKAVVKYPYDKRMKKRFRKLEEEARTRRRGLWGTDLRLPKAGPAYTVLVASKRGKKYHRPDCAAARRVLPDNRVEFEDATQAEAVGYQPCKMCSPK